MPSREDIISRSPASAVLPAERQELRLADGPLSSPHTKAYNPAGVENETTVDPVLPVSEAPLRRDTQRLVVLGFFAAVSVWFLWQVEAVLPPFIIAFFLAALFNPTVTYMQRRAGSRVRAILTLYLLGLCIVGVIAVFIVPLAVSQIEQLTTNSNQYFVNLQSNADHFLHRNAQLLRLAGIHQERLRDLVNQKSGPVKTGISAVLVEITGIVQGVAARMLWFIIIPVASFFLMRDYPALRARVISLFPEAYQDSVDKMACQIVDVFIAYLRGLSKICLLYTLVAFAVFKLMGLDYALFLCILAGIFYAVPYVGQLISAIAVSGVAYSMGPHTALFFIPVSANSAGYTILMVCCIFVMSNFFDQLVYPRVVGGSVGLHPVVSIFALMSGATLFGLWGMLLAVPVAASIQIVLLYCFPRIAQPVPERFIDETQPVI